MEACGKGDCFFFLVFDVSLAGLGFIYSYELSFALSSLRTHPHFRKIVASRLIHDDVLSVAKLLSDLSTGRQP